MTSCGGVILETELGDENASNIPAPMPASDDVGRVNLLFLPPAQCAVLCELITNETEAATEMLAIRFAMRITNAAISDT